MIQLFNSTMEFSKPVSLDLFKGIQLDFILARIRLSHNFF